MRKFFLGYEEYNSQAEMDDLRDMYLRALKTTQIDVFWRVKERKFFDEENSDSAPEFYLHVKGKTLRDKLRLLFFSPPTPTDTEWQENKA